MSPNVRKHRTYDDLDYNYLQKTLDISAISFHKMLQVAKKQDAIAEYGSVVASLMLQLSVHSSVTTIWQTPRACLRV